MTLRTRLLLGMAAVAVVLVATSVAITRATERTLVRQVDQQLERAVPLVRSPRGAERALGSSDRAEDPSRPSALYVALVNADRGTVTTLFVPDTTSANPSEPDLTASDAMARVGAAPFTVPARDGDLRYRVQVRADGPAQRTLLVALPLEDVDETIDRLITIEAFASLAILAVLGLVTFWVVRLGVRPVQQMTSAATAIGEGALSTRIPEGRQGTEAGDLGVALNQMLGRIQASFDERSRSEQRLRQFVADASHELRTPVTTIRGYAELYRQGGLDDETALDEAMRRTEQEATRMGDLVADLLALARLDSGRPPEMAPVDLGTVVADGVADARAVEPHRAITVEVHGATTVIGDDAQLRQVVGNLLTNARVHTAPGTPIAVRVHGTGTEVVLEVADAGPGMTPEVAARAFERFYRADPARSRARGGSGLGLSIVAAAVGAHGGTATIDATPGAGTVVRVRLPAAGDGLGTSA